MTRKSLIRIAALGSLLLLLGAFGFQYIGGLAPCKLCLWQRWPHAAAVVLGGAGLLVGWSIVPRLGALAAFSTAVLGLYHTGVERGWWQGPTSCTGSGPGLSGLSGEQLLSTEAAPNVVMCDQVAWQMWGLSMASWNAIASLVLVLIWIAALRAGPEPKLKF